MKGGDLASDDARQDAYAKYLDSQGIKRQYETDTEWKAEHRQMGNIQEGQEQAKSFKELLDIPSAAKMKKTKIDYQKIADESAKADEAQLKQKDIWAPYKKPIGMPIPDGYPYFLFQHPNKYSANPNQVMVADNQARFLKSDIYKKLKDKIVYNEFPTGGYGATAPEAKIVPRKDYRIVFLFTSPDKDEYVYDAKNKQDYIKVLDMCKDSGFIYPTEVLSKKFTDSNAAMAQAIKRKDEALGEFAWNAGAEETQNSWEQAVSTAENQEQAQKEYFDTIAEQKKREEEERNKKSGWDQFLDIAVPIVETAAKIAI